MSNYRGLLCKADRLKTIASRMGHVYVMGTYYHGPDTTKREKLGECSFFAGTILKQSASNPENFHIIRGAKYIELEDRDNSSVHIVHYSQISINQSEFWRAVEELKLKIDACYFNAIEKANRVFNGLE